ncbi:hypothetical protein Q4Q39_11845 [Flavivirga amylovorans]|uniref:Uncharacterized protein n=1 Tax=Flavivirga amylovorans TaxID=870486 RepID=A0ABT8X2C0_9FLAO|nr:hypothetical protein [Flavivirga amylovorans]MDO5988098.1 hypothetical protein [Flavivirga amylovorans]
MNKTNYKYGDIIELNINEVIPIDDSLSLELTYFTHKRPRVGGSTKATATVVASKNTISKDIYLSVRGINGKSEYKDGLSKAERFPPVIWEGYKFQLVERFKSNYGKSIKIIVLKKKKY